MVTWQLTQEQISLLKVSMDFTAQFISTLVWCRRYVNPIKLKQLKVDSQCGKRKNESYAQRIKIVLGGDFMPCVFSSGGVIGPAARKAIDCISKRRALSSI